MEHELIDWLTSRTKRGGGVRLGIGDDAAILAPSPGSEMVVTTDMLMDRVDFLWDTHDPALIGRKCLAVNLSDLAAMAAQPIAAFVSLAIPRSFSLLSVQQLLQGVLDLAAEFELEIAGGDTNTHDGPLVISVTAIGETPFGRAWRRDGAKPGDRILVSGQLGGSISDHQFTFKPRVREAIAWREAAQVHAAIDISDGLSLDLSRMLRASRVGAILEERRIPISDAARHLSSAGSGKSPVQHALGDGEDFELLLCAQPSAADELLAFARRHNQTLIDVGEITEDSAMLLQDAKSQLTPLLITGYEHQLIQ